MLRQVHHRGGFNRFRKFRSTISRGINSFFRKIIEKGNERLTVMFIPHSESRIFNLKISMFTMVFLWMILASVLVFGILAIEQNDLLLISKKELKEQNQETLSKLFEMINKVEPLEKNVSILKDNVERLKTVTNLAAVTGNIERESFLQKLYKYEQEQYSSDNNLSEISDLEKVQKDVLRLNSKIKSVTSSLSNLKKWLRVVPSIFPIRGGGYIISGYGYRRDPINYSISFHEGVDIILAPGAPIMATADGTVTHAEYGGGRGLYVSIQHKYGFSTKYYHCASISKNVYPGAKVKKGDIIATIGSTGRSTGAHLHYEVRINNYTVNPVPYINLKDVY